MAGIWFAMTARRFPPAPGRSSKNVAAESGRPLTLRSTGLTKPAAFAHLPDYSGYEDGREIGRIYEVPAPTFPELTWTWSIIALQ